MYLTLSYFNELICYKILIKSFTIRFIYSIFWSTPSWFVYLKNWQLVHISNHRSIERNKCMWLINFYIVKICMELLCLAIQYSFSIKITIIIINIIYVVYAVHCLWMWIHICSDISRQWNALVNDLIVHFEWISNLITEI